MNGLTHLDLFSGIGGFALAASWAGFRTVGFSEVEPHACRVLAERFPGVPNLRFIAEIEGKK
jgi:DNA (cytosine-5)-methyltransferase 1